MLIGRSPIFSPKSWNVRIDVPCAGKSSKPANYARPHFAHHLLVDPLPYQIHVNPNESNMRYWMWEVKKHLNNPQEVKLHMEVGFCHNAKTTPSLHPKKSYLGLGELLVESTRNNKLLGNSHGVGLNHPTTTWFVAILHAMDMICLELVAETDLHFVTIGPFA